MSEVWETYGSLIEVFFVFGGAIALVIYGFIG